MDTYRVKLPHPQPVVNEEEFVTNSGRRVKWPIVNNASPSDGVELQLPLRDGEDMLGSGLSVLSPSPGDAVSARDGQLTSSMQATLHLSLDRLSENYDPEDFKRLQEKTANSKMILTTERIKKLGQPIALPADEGSGGDPGYSQGGPGLMSQDSLEANDVEQTSFVPQLDSENSEEFLLSGEDDDERETVVNDSLNISTSRDGATPNSHHSGTRSNAVEGTAASIRMHLQQEDKYADLRYNPQWRQTKVQKVEPSPVVIDFKRAPKLEDSLEQPLSSQRGGGGAIVVHKKELYSPVVPDWGKESFPIFSSRSISPTRLSTDPVRLQQTNAQYEEEFNKMLKAEILNDAGLDRPHETYSFQEENSKGNKHRLQGEISSPHKESYSVLIRKLGAQDSPSHDEPPRAGGYQLLPDRHRIPSPSSVAPPSIEIRTVRKHQLQQRTLVKHSSDQGGYQSPEAYYYPGKKDPLVALSPREKSRRQIFPTPPKMPKPKDYIELNKQRLGRKTNSAGYLDIHRKKSRQPSQLKSRSQSDVRGTVSQETYNTQATGFQEAEYETGTVESIWMQQAEKLKVAKGRNVNKGKVIQRLPNPMQNGSAHKSPFVITHNTHNHSSENMLEDAAMNGNDWHHYNPRAKMDTSQQHFHQQHHDNYFHTRHPLPIPSQVVQHDGRMSSKEELMDSLNDSGSQKTYASPRLNANYDQESPLMKAYYSKYTTEAFEPLIYPNRANVLRQNFSEQNLALPQQRTVSRQPEVWTNMEAENELSPGTLPPSGYSSSRPTRKVTFLGDSETIAIEGISNGGSVPSSSTDSVYRLNKFKIPLPPTPPSKSLRHTVHKDRRFSDEKENEGHYDVRQDNFPILPPILKSHQSIGQRKNLSDSMETGSPKSESNGSYLEQHEKQKKKFHYKIYTLDDYKNLKKDVKLGGLGPDMESAREKMGNAERARKYAEMIRKEHMTNATIVKPKEGENEMVIHNENYHFTATMDEQQREDMLEKRKRAIEYSKRIPKPKPKPVPSIPRKVDKSPTITTTYSSELPPATNPEGIDFNWGLLQMLKDRHEKEKAQVAAFSGNP